MTILIRSLFCLLCLALAACGTAPRETFYTLNTIDAASAPLTAAANKDAAKRYTVAVGPVHVPEIVDRPQLVIRNGANQVRVLEQHRWAQALDAEIAQALAADLAARLPQARIGFGRDAAVQNPNYRVAVEVLRFDALPGDAVMVQANWTIRSSSAKVPLSGQSAVREAVAGNDYEAVAAAFSRAVMQISDEIAGAVSTIHSTNDRAFASH